MLSNTEKIDRNKVFVALADPNRRKIVELLHQKESTLLELSDHFSFSFQALSKHIKILEKASILHKKKEGKYRPLSLNRLALREVLEWVSYYSNFWNESFDQLDELINQSRTDEDTE